MSIEGFRLRKFIIQNIRGCDEYHKSEIRDIDDFRANILDVLNDQLQTSRDGITILTKVKDYLQNIKNDSKAICKEYIDLIITEIDGIIIEITL